MTTLAGMRDTAVATLITAGMLLWVLTVVVCVRSEPRRGRED